MNLFLCIILSGNSGEGKYDASDFSQFFFFFQLDIVNDIFIQNVSNPPLYKNHPPMAGAIYWARSLFYRIKRTIVRFHEVEELLASERGKEVCWLY